MSGVSSIYFIVLLLVVLLGKFGENNPKCRLRRDGSIFIGPDVGAAFLVSAILVLVSGLRYKVGVDFFSYYGRAVPEWEAILTKLMRYKEGGFSFLIKFARIVYDDDQTLIFLSAVITVGLSCWAIYRYHTLYLFSILIYIFAGDWQEGFNGIRQCMAAAIVFAGHRLILDKKYWQYILVVVFAGMFHATAVVMIMPIFLFNRKADITQILVLSVASIVARFSYGIIFSLMESFKEKSLNTTSGYLTNTVSIFRILVNFIPVAVYIFFCRKENHTREQCFYINALFFNAFSMLAGMGSSYMGRVGIYTGAAVTIGYGHLMQLIEDEKNRKIIGYFVLLMYLLYWIYSLDDIKNYRWVFDR